jgi:nucleotide-binding universal stress UspA family protein
METVENEKCILVPTDFSEACDNALNHAIEMAKYLKSKVYVLHVVDDLSKDFFAKDALEMGATNPNNFYDSLRLTTEKLKDYVATKKSDVIIPLIEEGDLFTAIKDVATSINAGMIILGTHGKHGFQKIVGSYALKVIDKTRLPVFVVQKRGFGAGYNDIVFTVNLSDEDRQKVEYAIQLSEIFNSTIHIFPQQTESAQSKAKLNVIVEQIKAQFDKHSVKYTVSDSSEYGEVWDRQVLNYSSSINADLILIMSNPDKHVMFFDSKEENIMFNSAQIPVLCVNYRNTKLSAFWGAYNPGGKNVY